MSAHARVRLGARLLDAKLPGWAAMVDPAALDVRTAASDVLGQLGTRLALGQGSHIRAHGALLVRLGIDTGRIGAERHGFDTRPDDDFERLQRAWLHEIALRRSPAVGVLS